jgi:hypothetical protein
MENKQQTAVDWLYEKLSTASSDELVGNINSWFIHAKEMEKEQIIKARHDGFISAFKGRVLPNEQYYNETFQNK